MKAKMSKLDNSACNISFLLNILCTLYWMKDKLSPVVVNHTAELRFCFRIFKNRYSLDAAQICITKFSILLDAICSSSGITHISEKFFKCS